jgi:hypothetical protein
LHVLFLLREKTEAGVRVRAGVSLRLSAFLGLVLVLAGCAPVREAAPFEVSASRRAEVRWQQGTQVFLRTAVCEESRAGAVRVTVGGKPAAREFLLEPDGMLFARGWAGQAGAAPPGLSVWASFLTIYQNARHLPEGDRELHTPAARIAVRKIGSRLESVAIRSLDTAESLSVVFRPAR